MELPENYHPIIDGDLAMAIGLLVTEWSGAQWFLTLALSELMIGKAIGDEDDNLHIAVLIGMDARPLIGLFKTLSPPRLGNGPGAEVAKILDRLEGAKDLRDLVCHCVWERDDKKDCMVARSAKTVGKYKEIARPVTVKDICEKITVLQDGALALLAILQPAGYLKTYAPSQGRPY